MKSVRVIVWRILRRGLDAGRGLWDTFVIRFFFVRHLSQRCLWDAVSTTFPKKKTFIQLVKIYPGVTEIGKYD